jgi:hypothetical protein
MLLIRLKLFPNRCLNAPFQIKALHRIFQPLPVMCILRGRADLTLICRPFPLRTNADIGLFASSEWVSRGLETVKSLRGTEQLCGNASLQGPSALELSAVDHVEARPGYTSPPPWR